MRDRQKLSEDGLVIVTFAMEKGSNLMVSDAEIVTKGFIYVKESDTILKEALNTVNETLIRCQDKGTVERNKIRNEIRDALSDFIWKQTKRSPMIITIITDVEY